MNVDDLSYFIHFDRDLRADRDISEHATLGSEAITPLPSRRRKSHLGPAIITRCERTGDEARSLTGLAFRMDSHDHVTFVDPERQFITNIRGGLALTKGSRFSECERGAGRRLDGIETGFHLTYHSLNLLMAYLHVSDLFGVRRIRLREQRGQQHDGGYDKKREDRAFLT